MSDEYIGKGHRFAPVLNSDSIFTPNANTWRINHALDCVYRAISMYLKHDINHYYHDPDNIKEKLPEIWNKAEELLKGDEKYPKLSQYIQSILVEEHEMFRDADLPIVYSETYRYVYVYPPKEFVRDVS